MEELQKERFSENLPEEYIGEELYRTLPSLENAEPLDIAKAIVSALEFKRGKNIAVQYVEDKTILAHYFVLCTANSNTHVKSLIDEVEYRLGLRGLKPLRVEGRDGGIWAVGDYSCVLVHVFSREAREFYNLDKLYGDTPSFNHDEEEK